MEEEWDTVLEQYFPDDNWRYHRETIIFYTMAVDKGLKPSYMWDFGPTPISADLITAFIQDLKKNNIISKDILVILVKWRIFIASIPNVLHALQQNIRVMDLSTNYEDGWFIGYKNDFIISASEYITKTLTTGNFQETGRVTLDFECHIPTVYGLLLGYPLIYYTERTHPPVSFRLYFYRVICKFRLEETSEDFPIYTFSIPKPLFTSVVESTVNAWFDKLRNGNKSGFELELEEWEDYLDAPRGRMR